MQRVVPVYEDLSGFSGLSAGAKSIEDLPKEAQAYVRYIEERTQTPAAIISTGPGREQAILVGDNHR
jgi:adenylosuccinate synthase